MSKHRAKQKAPGDGPPPKAQSETAEANPVDAPANNPAAEAAVEAAAAPKEPAGEKPVDLREEQAAAEADPLEQLRAEVEEAKDRALRSHAELDNYRKRAARELQDAYRYANLPLMRDLLPVLDNLDRAIESAEQNHDTASLLQGVKIVADQLRGVLERHHCVQIESLGKPFDPNLHQAILQQPSDEHTTDTVMLETQTGFRLHDRVVRPSQVIVAAKPEAKKTPEQEAQPEAESQEEQEQ